MSCKIEVAANKLGSLGPKEYYHLHIVHTAAEGNKTGLRGGPSASPASFPLSEISGGSSRGSSRGSSGSGSNPSTTSDSGGDSKNGPFGSIKTDVGPYDP